MYRKYTLLVCLIKILKIYAEQPAITQTESVKSSSDSQHLINLTDKDGEIEIPSPDSYRTFWKIRKIEDVLDSKDCWIVVSEKSIQGQQNDETKAFISHLNWLSSELSGVIFFGLVKEFAGENEFVKVKG